MTLGNLTMLNAVIPTYDDGKGEEELNGDDPNNNERINKILGF